MSGSKKTSGTQPVTGKTETREEKLSALFDGEASEAETRDVLDALTATEKARWQRFEIGRLATRGALKEEQLRMDISGSVAAAIAKEPALGTSGDTRKDKVAEGTGAFWRRKNPVGLNWLKPATGFAAAASVVFFVVVGGQKDFVAKHEEDGARHPLSVSKEGIVPVSADVAIDEDEQKALRKEFNEFYMEHFLRSGEKGNDSQ